MIYKKFEFILQARRQTILNQNIEMQAATFEADIKRWMIDFVEKPNEKLGSWPPCPYARKARLENKVKFQFVVESEFFAAIERLCAEPMDQFEAVVVGTLPIEITVSKKDIFSSMVREKYKDRDVWVLFDHPEELEIVAGVKMNMGRYLLAILQKKSKLDAARIKLAKDGYYDTWEPGSVESMTGMNLKKLKNLKSND